MKGEFGGGFVVPRDRSSATFCWLRISI